MNKKLLAFFVIVNLLFPTIGIQAQINTTQTNHLPNGIAQPTLIKQTKSTDLEKYRKIKDGQVVKTDVTSVQKDNLVGRESTIVNYSTDTRNLPLNANGKLVAPEGEEVNFVHPHEPDQEHWCWTPTPVVNDGNRDIACAFSVPCDNPANRDVANTSIKYFQLVWHVMMDGGPSTNISQTTINNLMAELNADYSTHNMVFCADPASFYEDAVNYTHNENTEEVSLKTTYNVTPTQVINIYVVGSMGPGGYARFPYDPMGGTSSTGGIVLNRGNCWVGSHTLSHEMGHVFGLEHTFAGVDERGTCSNCYEKVRNANGSSNTSGVATPNGGPYLNEGDREGDWCSDTNPHDTYSYNCSTSSNPNGGCDSNPWANAPVNNHMSYSFCSSQFTQQQSRRMHCMVNSYLAAWTSYGGGVCGSLPPVADFVGNPTTWIDPATVTFTDLSAPTAIITTWTWNFNNLSNPNATVTPSTFVGQVPPPVVYDVTSGVCEVFEVSLTINGPNGSDSEIKTAYIEVCPPAGDCDILDADWLTPTPTASVYNGGFGYFTGVPNEGSNAPIDPAGMYQQYFTPTPGTSVVGAVRVGLGLLTDPNDNMTVQVVVYEDDPGNPGFPDWGSGPIAVEAFSPTQVGIPNAAYVEFWVPFECAPTITGATFHVGVEMFPGDATDELVLISNAAGEGGAATTNTYLSTFCASEDYNVNGMLCGYAALDFDLDCYPMMGWWAPLPYAAGFTETLVCDTTYTTVFTGTLYDCNETQTSQILNWSYTFASDGITINSTTEVPTLNMTYTGVGPDLLTITSVNECGRGDTTNWVIPYNFNQTPAADFSMAQTNPVCLGDPIDFTGMPNTGMYSYTWDFGDGTTIGPGNIPTSPAPATGSFPNPTYTYGATGTYYVNMEVSSYGLQPSGPNIFAEGFEAGWPGWTRRNGDALTPAAPMTALGFGATAATSWLPLDVDGDGVTEATSTSWYNPAGVADDWFRTPLIAIPAAGQTGLFWTGESYSSTYPDGYEVRIRVGTVAAPTIPNYPTVIYSTAAENGFETEHVIDLSPYAGSSVSIAFRNNTNDGFMLMIDSIRVAPLAIACTANRNYLDFVEVIDCSIAPPVYTINATPTSGCVPLDVDFQSTFVSGTAASSFTWNFGDGGFAFVEDPGIHTYTTAGTYFVTYEVCNAGGCNTYYQTIVVDDVPTTSVAGAAQAQCGGTTATLAGNVPIIGTGVWTVIAGGGTVTTPTANNSGVTGLTPGANTFEWTITNGACTSTDQVTITVSTPPNAGTNGTHDFCSTGATADLFSDLGGTPDATGSWSPAMTSGTGVFDPATDAAGIYTYTVSAAGCPDATATVTTTVETAPNAGTNNTLTICASASPTDLYSLLGGTPDATGAWSGPSALTGGNLGTFDPAVNSPGVYTYTVTGTVCSNATATITVTLTAAPDAGTNGTHDFCSTGATADLFSDLGGTPQNGGVWSGPSALAGGDLGTFDPSINAAGTYTYTVTAAGCGNISADVVVTIETAPDAGLDGTVTYCDAGPGGDLFTELLGSPMGTGSWSPAMTSGTGVFDPLTDAAGTYTYTITGTVCANATANIVVSFETSPNAGISGTHDFCSNDIAADLFSDLTGSPMGTGSWSPALTSGTGVFDPAVDAAGTYTYTVTGTLCPTSTADVIVTIETAPNAGTNNTLNICAIGAPTDLITILGGTPDAGGLWSGPSALAGGDLGTFDPSTNAAGVYTYTVAGTICSNATATVTVNITAAPDAGTNGTHDFCSSGTTADLFSDLGGTPQNGGVWSGPSALAGGDLGTLDPSTNLAGTYTYTVTVVGCGSIASDVIVTIETAPDAGLDGTVTYCDAGPGGDLFTELLGTPAGTGSWSPVMTSGTGVLDPLTDAAGIYTYTVTGTVCPNATANVDVTIETSPDAGIDGTHDFCSTGTSADLFADLTGSPMGTGSWSPAMTSGTGVFDPAVDAAGTYTYTVTGTVCANATADIVVTIETAPDAGLDGTVTYCDAGPGGDLFTELLGTPAGTGSWSPAMTSGTGVFDPLTDAAGIYTYTVTGTVCPNATANVDVTIETSPDAGISGTHSFCSSDAAADLFADLTGSPMGTGSWSPAMTSGTGVFDPSVDAAGTYTYTVTGTVCANAIADVVVTINTAPDPGTGNTIGICATSTPVDLFTQLGGTPDATGSWSPALTSGTGVFDPAVDAAGAYTYTVTGTSPCIDATAIITVNITAADDPAFVYNDFCAGSGGLPTSEVTPGGTWTFNPDPADGSTIDLNTGVITGEVAGSTYMIEYTTPAGPCQSSGIQAVNIGTPADAGTNGIHDFCSSDLAADLFSDLGGTPNATGSWSPVISSGTGVFDPAVDLAGTYTYSVTGTNGCPNASADVVVSIETAPNAGTNGTLNICASAAATDLFLSLGGTPDATGVWSPAMTSGTGFFDPAVDAATTYTYTVTGTVCANATADVVVTIVAADDPTFVYVDYCAGTASAPSGVVTPGGTFSFNPLPGDGATIDSNTGVISNEVAGNSYTIQYNTPVGPCQDSSMVTLTIGTPVDGGVNGSGGFCSTDSPLDLFTLLGGTPDATGSWSPAMTSGTGVYDPASDPAGVYTYTVIGNNGCPDGTADVTVTLDVAPDVANAGLDQSLCDTLTLVTLAGNTPVNGTGVWTVVSGSGTFVNANSATTDVNNPGIGANDYMWTISNGSCTPSTDMVTITLDPCTVTAIEIPTGFTPDGDGVNDVWEILNIDLYPNSHVEVYNRWGSLLYMTDNYFNNPWDGKFGGKMMPLGSYYFTVDLGDGSETRKGTVTIIK